ncbi:hypothetical protein P3T27_007538 [Kitasatospora sp. MAA19]|uniref:hypothetical protein n=1 Tax=unclassified Kitasatospora TaxID=2633591 RepID=UPI002474B007|nr:hypothetical protein [Kitasatospora sp. MAA19]MDH6710787.1 hypothetical protein [Kitasatospora sp. MAA19]
MSVTLNKPAPDDTPDEDEVVDAELLDDDHPGPRPVQPLPWWERQRAHTREGLRVLAAERGAWLTGHNLSDEYVAVDLLNGRHRQWKGAQDIEHTNLSARAKEHHVEAKKATSASRVQSVTPTEYGAARKTALAATATAAQWEQQAAAVLARSYQNHLPATPAEISEHRRRIASRRLWRRCVPTVLAVVGTVLLTGGAHGLMVVGAAAAAAVTVAGWAKGANPSWRAASPQPPGLAYPVPEGTLLVARNPAPDEQRDPAAAPTEPPAAAPAPGPAGAPRADAPQPTGQPYPIRLAATPEQAGQCIHLALRAEGLAVGSVTDVSQERWGWRATAHLTKGRPSTLVAKLPDLEVLLGVQQNGVMAQPQRAAAGSVVLRVITSDPFAQMPEHPVYAPKSNSILNPVNLGPSMDGTATTVVLAGQNMLVVAASGGGKSALVRTMADYVTSCYDAVAWDIDPTGRGLGPLRGAAGRTAYTKADIDKAIGDIIRYAQARTRLLGDDVDNWQVTEDAPAIIVFCDEFLQLTPKQRARLIQGTRITRKVRISLVILVQDGTADAVGDAIADALGIRIMLPCRLADVPLVVGSSTAVSEGWAPHRLTPSPGDWDPADAGKFYILGPGLTDPILRKCTYMGPVAAKQRAVERQAAGIVQIDAATLTEAGHDAGGDDGDQDARIGWVAAAFDNDAALSAETLLERLTERWPDEFGDWNRTQLRDLLKPLVGVPKPVNVGGKTARGYRLQDLTDALEEA